MFAYSHNYKHEKELTHYLHPITVQGLTDGKKLRLMNKNNYCKTPQKKFRLPLCASVSIWWVFEECVQGWCMRTDFSNSRLPDQRFPVVKISHSIVKLKQNCYAKLFIWYRGSTPRGPKPSHGFPLVCKALRKRNRQFRRVIRKRRILRLNFDGLDFYFSITRRKYFPLISCYSPA